MESTFEDVVATPRAMPPVKPRHRYRGPKATNVEIEKAKQTAVYLGNGIYSSVKITLDAEGETAAVRYSAWDKTALAAYSGYSKLYGERKYAAVDTRPCSKISFLDLPAEIRNLIYTSILVPESGYIDFSPKTNGNGSNGPARHHHVVKFAKDTLPYLKLLRTCKQICAEAASIFYGNNEFRFTSIKGYYVLDAFLRQIGTTNQSLLRKIAIHVPFLGSMIEGPSCPDYFPESANQLGKLRTNLTRMGLRPRYSDRAFGYGACVRRTNRIFEEHGQLESLRIVLPDTFEVGRVSDKDVRAGKGFDSMVPDAAKSEKGLEVSLVRLHGGLAADYWGATWGRDERRECLRTQTQVKKFALEQGWEIVVELYDDMGYYPVALPEGEELGEISDGED